MTTTYQCPFCPQATQSLEEIEAHIDKAHPERMDEAMRIFYDKFLEQSTILIPFSRITPAELGLLKGDWNYDHANQVIRIPRKGNEWLLAMLAESTKVT